MTLTVTIPVEIPTEFNILPLELFKSTHNLTITLEAGDHVYTSSDFELGVIRAVHNRPLIGRITFRYTYDAESHTITVSETDYPSASTMALVTFPKDMLQHTCVERTIDGCGFAADDVSPGSYWNPRSTLMSGAANESLLTALKGLPDTCVRIRALPSPSFVDAAETYAVHKDGEPAGTYSDFVEQQKFVAGEGVVIAGIASVVGGTEHWPQWYRFSNILGSLQDPKHGWPTWISLWTSYFGAPGTCTSLNYMGTACSTHLPLHGGHVVKGTTPTNLPNGSNSAYIIPICQTHNFTPQAPMACVTNGGALWLNNYMG